MKKLLVGFVLTSMMLSSFMVKADTCLAVRMLEDKLASDIQVKNDLEASIYLSEKLKDASKWEEFSNIKEQAKKGEHGIESNVFTAKEIDILLLIDALNDTKSDLNKELTFNALKISSSIAMTYVTTKVVNKLLAGGFKSGFMLKIQTMINNPDRAGKVNKLMHLSNILALVTPAYLGYKEYKIYNMLKSVREKIDILEELSASLPELEVLEERIEHDKIRIEEVRAANKCN